MFLQANNQDPGSPEEPKLQLHGKEGAVAAAEAEHHKAKTAPARHPQDRAQETDYPLYESC